MKNDKKNGPEKGLMDFLASSPTPFHACETLSETLRERGYAELKEGETWSVEAGQRYMIRRGHRLIAAVNLGSGDIATTGARIVASHIDSPCLRLKRALATKVDASSVLNVMVYGSPILHTWQDRDLEVAGCAFVVGKDNGISRRLVRSESPVCRVVSLAPHLRNPSKEPSGAAVEAVNLRPILGPATLSSESLDELIAAACGKGDEKIVGWDLVLSDTQAPSIVGLTGDYLSSARLDNLFSAYCQLSAFTRKVKKPAQQTEISIWYDSEEIGSQTVTGARSDFLATLIGRLAEQTSGAGCEPAAMARANSVILSVDMAHTENPGYPNRLDPEHMPKLNEGLAIKYPAQGNYAESSDVAAWFEHACREREIPLQHFMYRTGHRGGASLGPIATTASGIRGIDVGTALMGMHSIREMCGVHDIGSTIDALRVFFEADLAGGLP